MILILGGLVDSIVAHIVHRLTDRKVPFLIADPRQFGQTWMLTWERRGGVFRAWLTQAGQARSLDDIRSVYVHEATAEMQDAPLSSNEVRWLLNSFIENTPMRVANRLSATATNFSKPWQQQVIAAAGFVTPRTLVTNLPDAAREFYGRCKRRVIYKSVSARRSIVQRMTDADLERLDLLAAGPVQFQEWLPGVDIRVHVMGSQVYATEITTEATDYRYSGREEKGRTMSGITLPEGVSENCVQLTQALGLVSAGVDLRRMPAGKYCCFEVNARPAFSFFEQYTGQRIADGLIDALLT
ncbi:MAG TPA: hypothetical protein VHZ32_05120 [Rhizomicrobium sp.]|nr:hypothetical protein [Rhizomicrobium sp.]